MTTMTVKLAGTTMAALLFAASSAVAQAPDSVRVRATIESVDGQMVTAKSRDGGKPFARRLSVCHRNTTSSLPSGYGRSPPWLARP